MKLAKKASLGVKGLAMKTRVRTFLLLASSSLAFVLASTQPLLAANNCRAVDADLVGDLPSIATGTITRGGILNGTAAVIENPGYVVAADNNFVTFTSTLTITTDRGTLTTSNVTIIQTVVVTHEFSSIAKIVSGTGIFAGATGRLYISGAPVGSPTGGDIQARIIGEICLAQ